MRLLRALVSMGGLIAASVSAGCVLEVTFDPVGQDASVEAAWQINGTAPTAASCAELGADSMRIVFYDLGTPVLHADLVANCESGLIDTGDRLVLADGAWDMQLQAIDATGQVVVDADGNEVVGPIERHDTIADGGRVVLRTVNFDLGFNPVGSDASAEAAWTINGLAPSSAVCSALGIDQMRVVFYNGSTPVTHPDLVADCELGSFDTRPDLVVTGGTWTVQLQATNSSGAVINDPEGNPLVGPMESVNTSSGHIALTTVDFAFFDPAGADSVLQATWTLGGQEAGEKTCDALNADTLDILFFADDDTDLENGVVVQTSACSDGSYTSTTPVLAAGTYRIAVELYDAESTPNLIADWEAATPAVVTVTAGNPLVLDFDLELLETTGHFFINYEDPSSIGTFVECPSEITSIDYQVILEGATPEDDEVIAMAEEVACVSELQFFEDLDGNALPPGTYELCIEGYEGTRKAWQLPGGTPCTCLLEIDQDGAFGINDCDLEYVEE